MRSIALVAPRTLDELILPDPPDPAPGEVLVKLHTVGICGSDMHWYLDGHIGHSACACPQVLGHEPAGEVVAVGAGVQDRKVGDRVSIEPTVSCGHCEYCLAGCFNNCVSGVFMGGPQATGLFREYANVPAHNADLVPSNLTWTQAALIEPVAVMAHLMELTRIRVGDTVAVMGAGPIGMLCATMAKLSGASRVFTCDRAPHRLELARKMGADVAVAPDRMLEAVRDETRGRGVDLAIDAAGSPAAIDMAIHAARPGATVMLIGIPSDVKFSVDLHTAYAKELRLQTLKRSNHKGAAAARLLEAGKIPDVLVTHVLPLAETGRGFEMLAEYADGVGKVLIDVRA